MNTIMHKPVEETKEQRTERIYNDHWKKIIEKDGKVDLEAVKKELADFWFVLENAPRVYSAVTGGKITKIFYTSRTILKAAEEYLEELCTPLINPTPQSEAKKEK